jgi:hypothetical protein
MVLDADAEPDLHVFRSHLACRIWNLDLLKMIKSILHKNYDDFTKFIPSIRIHTYINKCGSESPVTPNCLLNFRFFLDIPFVITSPTSVQPFQLDSQAKVSFHNIL